MHMVVFLSFVLASSAASATNEGVGPVIDIPLVKFRGLISNADFRHERLVARDSLVTLGILQISGIPNYVSARQKALLHLASCLEDDLASFSTVMPDGTYRRSTASAYVHGIAGDFTSPCGQASFELREAVDIGVRYLFRALDHLADRSVRNGGSAIPSAMKPYETYEELVHFGEHLEHLHAYYSGLVESSAQAFFSKSGVHQSRSADAEHPRSSKLASTVDFHTDGGLFIAMTTGLYKNGPASSESGLYIRTPDGSVARAILEDDSVVVMVGEAGARWLGQRLSVPFKAVEHALVAGLQTSFSHLIKTESTAGKSEVAATRAWFGKMYLPPADAIIPTANQALLSFDSSARSAKMMKMSYGEYRDVEKSILAFNSNVEATKSGLLDVAKSFYMRGANATDNHLDFSLTKGYHVPQQPHSLYSVEEVKNILAVRERMLPVACSASLVAALGSSKVPSALEMRSSSTACGTNGAMCWAQCYSLAGFSCSASEVQCVDTSNNDAVTNGNDMCPGNPMDTACVLKCPIPSNSEGNSTNKSSTSLSTEKKFCYGYGTSMIMSGFKSQLKEGPGNAPCIILLFSDWTLDTRGKFAGACIGTVFIGLLIGFITRVRSKLVLKLPESYWRWKLFLSIFLLAVNITLGYFDMLIAMTYNAELFVMVVIGLAMGNAIFTYESALKTPERDDIPCCSLPTADEENCHVGVKVHNHEDHNYSLITASLPQGVHNDGPGHKADTTEGPPGEHKSCCGSS